MNVQGKLGAFLLLLVLSASMDQTWAQAQLDADHHEQCARRVLDVLVGEWRFELLGTGSAEPGLTGVREFTRHSNEWALHWHEQLDEMEISISGVLGYDPARQSFYEFGLASIGAGEYALGQWRDGCGQVLFEDVQASENGAERVRTALRIHSADHFEFRRLIGADGSEVERWRADFRRQ